MATAEWDPVFLSRLRMTVGLAIRISPFAGPFRADDETADLLVGLAAGVLNQARDANLAVAELQVDFDCAESKLSGYRTWVEAIRQRASPTPVVIAPKTGTSLGRQPTRIWPSYERRSRNQG